MSAVWPVHVALIARLKATAGVTALVGQRIHDGQAPQGETLPYVVIDSQIGDRARTLERDGDNGSTNVNIWSSYQGMKEAAAIATAIGAALATPLTVTGWGTVRLMWDQAIPLVAGANLRHMIERYTYFVLSGTAES